MAARKIPRYTNCVVCDDILPLNRPAHQRYCSGACVTYAYKRRHPDRVKEITKRETLNGNHRKRYLKYKYGLSLEQYDEILVKQNGVCAVCWKTPEEQVRNFAVDHDHVTGEIRGVICDYCNRRVIGRHRSPDLFLRASEYLRQGTGLFVPTQKIKQRRRKR
jgi:hypothetical protein